jgi:hypothetical protein
VAKQVAAPFFIVIVLLPVALSLTTISLMPLVKQVFQLPDSRFVRVVQSPDSTQSGASWSRQLGRGHELVPLPPPLPPDAGELVPPLLPAAPPPLLPPDAWFPPLLPPAAITPPPLAPPDAWFPPLLPPAAVAPPLLLPPDAGFPPPLLPPLPQPTANAIEPAINNVAIFLMNSPCYS